MQSPKNVIILSVLTILLLFYAGYTDHRWEDWYITYKVSKNLAEGQGLVYMPGQKVHAFTSAFNVLVPAIFAFFAPFQPDEFAIWGYRITNCIVLVSACFFLLQVLRKIQVTNIGIISFGLLFCFNSLIIDNSINGMEAPYMMFFFSTLLYGLYTNPIRRWLWMGISLAGLMYTRPDGFVYAIFIFIGYYVFNFQEVSLDKVKEWGLWAFIAIVLYLPWLVFVWSYYGNPIPNTILAKGNLKTYHGLDLVFGLVIQAKNLLLKENVCSSYLFLPGYAGFGGWFNLEIFYRFLIGVLLLLFLFKKLPKTIKSFALSGYLMVYYLEFLSGQGGMPWYLPNPTLMVVLVFSILIDWVWQKLESKIPFYLCYTAFFSMYIGIFFLGSYYFKTQQRVVEFGNRKKIGEYIKAHSAGNETVFAECLGYIGFFSQQKMYDYPGMSSKEVVTLLAKVKKSKRPDYGDVVQGLEPQWVVLRKNEIVTLNELHPQLLQRNYYLEKQFNVLGDIPNVWYLCGRKYLEFDANFYLFKRKSPNGNYQSVLI